MGHHLCGGVPSSTRIVPVRDVEEGDLAYGRNIRTTHLQLIVSKDDTIEFMLRFI